MALKEVLSAIFLRRGGDGEHSGVFERLRPELREMLLDRCPIKASEEPVLGCVRNNGAWLLMTTERVVSCRHGVVEEVAVDSIVDVRGDVGGVSAGEVMKNELDKLEVVESGGRVVVIEVEPGIPLVGAWSVLVYLSRRNRG